jgi:hypothetical protein
VNPYFLYGQNPAQNLQLGVTGGYQPTAFGVNTPSTVRVTGENVTPQSNNVSLRGATPPSAQENLRNYMNRAGEVVGAVPGQVREAGRKLKERFPQAGGYARGGLAIAGALPAVGQSVEELQAGRPLGAVAALAPAGLSAAGAALIGRGTVGTVAGLGLMGLGALLPGAAASGAESTRQKITGEPTKGKEGEFSTQLAMQGKIGELGLTQYRNQIAVDTAATKDLTQFYSNQQFLDAQRMIPLVNQMKNADMTRQQALMNTQGQIGARLGILATAGALAQGAQAQTGETLRTALTSNPYAGSTIQAPAVRFG